MVIASKFVQICKVSGAKLFVGQIVVLACIALVFSEDFVAQNALFSRLSRLVGSVVPAVFNMAGVSPYPALTALLASLSWVFIPVITALAIVSSNFWRDSMIERMRPARQRSGRFMNYVAGPLFVACFILGDFNVFPILGFFRMPYATEIIQSSWQMRMMYHYPVTIALFYSMTVIFTAGVYSLAIVGVGERLLILLRKLHIVKQPVHS